MPRPFESREEGLAWICKKQLGRRNLTPEQKKFLIGKQYSVEPVSYTHLDVYKRQALGVASAPVPAVVGIIRVGTHL